MPNLDSGQPSGPPSASDLAFLVDRRVVASVENRNLLFFPERLPGEAQPLRKLLRVTPPWKVLQDGSTLTGSDECPDLSGMGTPVQVERWEAWCSRLACLDKNTVRAVTVEANPGMLRLHLDSGVTVEAKIACCLLGLRLRPGQADQGLPACPES